MGFWGLGVVNPKPETLNLEGLTGGVQAEMAVSGSGRRSGLTIPEATGAIV